MASSAPIGVFDSGLGGISVLRALRAMLPGEDYLYFGDSGHAPYGDKPLQEVQALSLQAAQLLLSRGAKAIVIACNTATSAAATLLRERYP
ncbi:MAG TPA: aspartate/glutamate racemase family protein, partial [Candidatus Avoscillospira stercoripullorum]|nr:aspartate/glutamate racemase family protein [Candidatus Avoscillospira stercoripullorum]